MAAVRLGVSPSQLASVISQLPGLMPPPTTSSSSARHPAVRDALAAAAAASFDWQMLRTEARRRLAGLNALLRPLTPTTPSVSRSLTPF